MKKSMPRLSSQSITVLIGILTVILSLVFGAGSAFIQKNGEEKRTWKYPYVYFYEEWKDIPIELLACDLGKNPELYDGKVEELKNNAPQRPDETDPDFEKKLAVYQEEMAEYDMRRAELDNALVLSQLIPTSNYNAAWYALLLPTLFGTEIVAFFFVAEIVLLLLLCIRSRYVDPAKKEQLAIKIAVAAYLIYLFSFLTLFMISRTSIMGTTATMVFSPVAIIGFLLGAVCIGALFLKKRISKEQKAVTIKTNAKKARTVLVLIQMILFAIIGYFALKPVLNLHANGTMGFLEAFVLTAFEPKYDSFEMFLALAGFVLTVSLIGICAKGIYNSIYYLYYKKNTYGGDQADLFQNIFAVVFSTLILSDAYAIKLITDHAVLLASPAVPYQIFSVEPLPLILLLAYSAIVLTIPIIINATGKKKNGPLA